MKAYAIKWGSRFAKQTGDCGTLREAEFWASKKAAEMACGGDSERVVQVEIKEVK